MEKTLQLIFKDTEGSKKNISISNPKDGLTKAEAADAMAKIIAANVFATSGGDLVEAVEARIVNRQVQALE